MRLMAGLLFCIWTGFASAQAQLPDKLILDGGAGSLSTTPLQPALESDVALQARLKRYMAKDSCAALSRGYLATWEVRENTLYLVRVEVDACKTAKAVPLSLLFPGATGPVKASWYTGELRLQRGAPDRNQILYVKAGTVTGTLTLEREKGGK